MLAEELLFPEMHYYPPMTNLSWPFTKPKKAACLLFAIMVTLIVAHVIAMQLVFNDKLEMNQKFGLEYWHLSVFDLDEEESFGTWFSTVMLLVSSILLFYRARTLRARQDSWYRWWSILGWLFLLLSIDEVAGIHELLNTLIEGHSWTIAGMAVLGLVGLAYLPFLWHYRGRSAVLLVIAGAIYGGGAVGVEHVSGNDLNSLRYNMSTALEEGMEMFGVIVFIYTLLEFIQKDSAR